MSREIISTIKGIKIPLEKILAMNENTLAVGNLKVNARGDIIGKGGQITKTKTQAAEEYYRSNPSAVKKTVLQPVSEEFKTIKEISNDLRSQMAKQEKPKKK